MNKKQARNRKHQREKEQADILDSEIIGDVEEIDEIDGDFEEEETLLGNLASVKEIPMIGWLKIPPAPLENNFVHFPFEKDIEGFEKLFTDAMNNEDCNLVGFTPMRDFYGASNEEAAKQLDKGGIGTALEIKNVEKGVDGSLTVSVRGICRFHNLGIVDFGDDYFIIKVRWFEDKHEPESVVRPLFERYLKIIERLSKIGGEQMKGYFNVSQTVGYSFESASYSSFLLLDDKFENWFTNEEKLVLYKINSVSIRLKGILLRVEKILPVLEEREKKNRQGRLN